MHTAPSTASTSKTHEPKTSPVPMSADAEKRIATREMESSGRQLPAAMMVQPSSGRGTLRTSGLVTTSSAGTYHSSMSTNITRIAYA